MQAAGRTATRVPYFETALAFTHGLLYAEPMDMPEPLLVDLRTTC